MSTESVGLPTNCFADPSSWNESVQIGSPFTVGFIVEKLWETCPDFREFVRQKRPIESVLITEIGDKKGFASTVYRCLFTAASIDVKKESKTDPMEFSVVLKIPNIHNIQVLLDSFLSSDKESSKTVDEKPSVENETLKNCDKQVNSLSERLETNSICCNDNQKHPEIADKPKPEEMQFAIVYLLSVIHNTECNFYEFAKQLSADANTFPVPLAHVFYAEKFDRTSAINPNDDKLNNKLTKAQNNKPQNTTTLCNPIIIMEDLSQTAKMGSIFEGASRTQVEQVANALADMHGMLLNMADQSTWKAFAKNPLFDEGLHDKFAAMEMKSVDKMIGLRERHSKALHRLSPFWQLMKSQREFKQVWTKKYTDTGMPLMFTHGDLWMNNMLWKKDRPDDQLAAIIDWQLVHEDNIANDISHFTTLCVDANVRRAIEKDILKGYLDRLNAHLSTPLFSFENLHRAYRLALVEHLFKIVFLVNFFGDLCAQNTSFKELYGPGMESLHVRLAGMLEDSIKVLEEEAPEWLLSAAEDL